MTDLDRLREAAKDTVYFAVGTLVTCAPTGNTFDCYTEERAAYLAAAGNAHADGSLVLAAELDHYKRALEWIAKQLGRLALTAVDVKRQDVENMQGEVMQIPVIAALPPLGADPQFVMTEYGTVDQCATASLRWFAAALEATTDGAGSRATSDWDEAVAIHRLALRAIVPMDEAIATIRNLPDSSGGCPPEVREALFNGWTASELALKFEEIANVGLTPGLFGFVECNASAIRQALATLATIESHIASTQEEAERICAEDKSIIEGLAVDRARLVLEVNTLRTEGKRKVATLESRIAELERVREAAREWATAAFEQGSVLVGAEKDAHDALLAALSTATKEGEK